jgi:hypothetical protein
MPLATIKKFVAVNERGLRIGEDHPMAKLSNVEVECIRALNEQGVRYPVLAQQFEVSVWTIGRICRYERRAVSVVAWRRVA